ncbi:MAG: NAD-dependent epimerase/dehydratase family protein [Candidatus Obscuribacterales bacterium]|nr:NAD-dependent epimerase/dehydratase family protein [Candidatus Obscuribacterales bacterium]
MKILVIGGTVFVGRHIVEAALSSGHEVTLFNRGEHNPDLFPEVETIRGDRALNLERLQGLKWDVVIDTCGYLPRVVRMSTEVLHSSCDLYVFISSGSVYKDKSKFGINEDAPLEVPTNLEAEEMTDETYGELKVGCEQVVQAAFGDRALIIRPGLIVGPYDTTDRFTYWPLRVAAGGRVLAPGNPERQVQFIDGRDLAEWTILLGERKVHGVFNAIGPDYSLSMAKFLNECKAASNSNAEFVWASDDWLAEQSVNRWTDMPLWIPEKCEAGGFLYRDNSRGIATGLKFRPVRETIADTLKWWQSERVGTSLKEGLKREREGQLLAILTGC